MQRHAILALVFILSVNAKIPHEAESGRMQTDEHKDDAGSADPATPSAGSLLKLQEENTIKDDEMKDKLLVEYSAEMACEKKIQCREGLSQKILTDDLATMGYFLKIKQDFSCKKGFNCGHGVTMVGDSWKVCQSNGARATTATATETCVAVAVGAADGETIQDKKQVKQYLKAMAKAKAKDQESNNPATKVPTTQAQDAKVDELCAAAQGSVIALCKRFNKENQEHKAKQAKFQKFQGRVANFKAKKSEAQFD